MQRHVRPALRQLVDIEHKTVIVKRTTGERAGIRLAQSTNRMAAEQCRAIARAIRMAARVTNDESSAETGAAGSNCPDQSDPGTCNQTVMSGLACSILSENIDVFRGVA